MGFLFFLMGCINLGIVIWSLREQERLKALWARAEMKQPFKWALLHYIGVTLNALVAARMFANAIK